MSYFAQLSEEEQAAVDDWIDGYRRRCRECGNVAADSAAWLEFAREVIASPENDRAREGHLRRYRERRGRRGN